MTPTRTPVRLKVETVLYVEEHVIEGVIYSDRRKVVEWCIGTRDAQVRRGLIELGWTPPKRKKV